MAFASTMSDDWGGGMYRGKRAPANAAFDLANLLINDESQLFMRGGSAYHSNADAGDALIGLFDGYLSSGLRTLMWAGSGATNKAYILNSDDATPAALTDVAKAIDPFARGAVANGILYLPSAKDGGVTFWWGGSRKPTADATTPTVSLTNDSATMTASGTSWASKYEAGSIVTVNTGTETFAFTAKSVDSNTQITLSTPWTGATGSYSLTLIFNHFSSDANGGPSPRITTSSGAPARIWQIVDNNRAFYSDRGGGNLLFGDNYIDLASASYIVGADSFQDTVSLFSTDGIWNIANTSLDPVDDFGNIQWDQRQISREFVLWGDPGIASYSGTLVVPGVDDVCLYDGQSLTTITGGRGSQYDGGIRNLYRSYVAQGYQPGTASVHRSHYLLPIVDGTTLVDVLICRLDHGFAWSRWEGHAASTAYARRAGSTVRSPKLLGISGQRVTDLTGCFTPDGPNATDATGATIEAQITTRDYPTSQQPGFVARIRARYEMDVIGGPLAAPWITDPWANTSLPVPTTGTLLGGGNIPAVWRSYFSTQPQTAPLATSVKLVSRPVANIDANAYAALGFVQTPGNGYEARIRYEVAADTVTIERFDNTGRTRIAGPTNLGARIEPFDTLDFHVATDGTLSVLINGVTVATVNDTTYFHAGQNGYIMVGISDQPDTGASSAILLQTDLPLTIESPLTVEYSSDADGGTWTELEDVGEQGGGVGWGASDGSLYQWATVGKKRERIRFRFTLAGRVSSFVWRSLEMLTRASGKQ